MALSSLRILAALLAAALVGCAAAPDPRYAWAPKADRWTESDERDYAEFVARIGASNCQTPDECLKGEANPFAASDPPGLDFSGDCADLVYVLRAYFAWKRGLPFSFVVAVDPRGPSADVRFSKDGNVARERRDVVAGDDVRGVFRDIRNRVSTANFRIDPRIEGAQASDFYSPAIRTGSIKAGSVVYHPNGHVVIVTRVAEDGHVHYVDAHTDGTLTRGVFGPQFDRSSPELGAGFRAWRPQRSEGGAVVRATNAEIADESMEQYFGPGREDGDWHAAVFDGGAAGQGFAAYVRSKLAAPGERLDDPSQELRFGLWTLCQEMRNRVRFVERASARGIAALEPPERISRGDPSQRDAWMRYSTPSRDRRLRLQVVAVHDRIAALTRGAPAAARARLAALYLQEAKACVIPIRDSLGQPRRILLDETLRRAFDMSFDPYHCPERRWGLTGEAAAACPDGEIKTRWYAAQARMRNDVSRSYEYSGFSLEELEARAPGSGADAPPAHDLGELLGATN